MLAWIIPKGTNIVSSERHGPYIPRLKPVGFTPITVKCSSHANKRIIWAGRYQLPLTAQQFIDEQEKRSVRPNDSGLIDQLFEKLAQIFSNEWQARKNQTV
ncbi:MAG: hypothetical protein JO250_10425 [Armatimonadetes bacterium]|nr:hypothetical protein [Armatimonadota bacterium]